MTMSDPVTLTILLATGTFATRFAGVALGGYLPSSGPWTRALNALPGCLIISLVAVMLTSGTSADWIGAGIALGVAIWSRSLPLTMLTGITAVWLLRTLF